MTLHDRFGIRVSYALGAVTVLAIAISGIVVMASSERKEPTRCTRGLVPMGFRCCAEGQHFDGTHCRGTPAACPVPLTRTEGGCVSPSRRIAFAGGVVDVGAADWQGETQPPATRVPAFALDAFEVTLQRWQACVAGGQCEPLRVVEPGLPVTGVGVDAAQRYCRFAGGRLPSGAEWMFVAMGSEARRYPWGMTGLVCRRAVYDLLDACGTGATGPEWAGTRPDGATPEGVYDMSGNVAEWTVENDGRAVARGGSFRSNSARQLKTGSMEDKRAGPDVGFRCAYDAEKHVSEP